MVSFTGSLEVIVRRGKHEIRCFREFSSDIQRVYFLSVIEEPFPCLQDAVTHLVNWKRAYGYPIDELDTNPITSANYNEAIAEWMHYGQTLQHSSSKTDLDAFTSVVRQITEPQALSRDFLLVPSEAEALEKAVEYLQRERHIHLDQRLPSQNMPYFIFLRGIDKLLEGFKTRDPQSRTPDQGFSPYPNRHLTKEMCDALFRGTYYLRALETTYRMK